MGDASRELNQRRSVVRDMQTEGDMVNIDAKAPVADMFGLASDLRSATGGRGSQFLVDQLFEKVPDELQMKVIKQIRERKGIKME